MIHKALQLATAGDVIVVDGGGDLTNSLIGDIMLNDANLRNLGGVVINGAIRDSGSVTRMALPVFAAGVTHRGPYKDGPGEVNVPIAIDGMVIEPGDLIIGDEDGVLCVPYMEAAQMLEAAQAKQALESEIMAALKAGTVDRSWIDESLKRLNCYIEE